ncbi:unnamed protein product [Lactuca virosa]|uniref:Uncharacterized protein n=1 Tax=Lactuca virosa TaxID=75947 RepID=A0AAU9N583_9ASTR|nr:unnamed protein product [Lactuca virosa]
MSIAHRRGDVYGDIDVEFDDEINHHEADVEDHQEDDVEDHQEANVVDHHEPDVEYHQEDHVEYHQEVVVQDEVEHHEAVVQDEVDHHEVVIQDEVDHHEADVEVDHHEAVFDQHQPVFYKNFVANKRRLPSGRIMKLKLRKKVVTKDGSGESHESVTLNSARCFLLGLCQTL